MSINGLPVFDTTVHKTNTWLKEIMSELGSEDRQEAYDALRATLHALRDRLTVVETAQLSAQLPMLIRGIYYEGWDPSGKPLKERHLREYLAQIQRELKRDTPVYPEQAARAVFTVFAHHVTEGEIEDVKRVLPSEIRQLWA